MEIQKHGHVLLLGDSKKRKEERNMRNWKKKLGWFDTQAGTAF